MFSVMDIESREWIHLVTLGFYDGKDYHHFEEISEYLDFIFARGEKIVFAHYGGIFDFRFIIEEVFENDNFEIFDLIMRGKGILSMKVKNLETKEVVKFSDSSGILPFSLATLSKNFDVETKKQEGFDSSKITRLTKEVISYNRDDCIALFQCIEKYLSNPLIKKSGMKITTASQALAIYKKIYQTTEIPRLGIKEDDYARRSYFGGRTEIFKPVFQSKKETLKNYDINSLYPFVMRDNDFPLCLDYETNSFEKDQLGIYEITIKSPDDIYIPVLGVKADCGNGLKYIFPKGVIRGYFCSPEINLALKEGYKILKVHSGKVYKNGGKIFKTFVNDLYEKRLEAKRDKKGADEIIYKLMMNSLYGRFGMNVWDKEKMVFDDGSEGITLKYEFKTSKGRLIRIGSSPSEMGGFSFSNVLIATFVTSYARCENYKYLKKFQKSIHYTDTDSFFTTETIKEKKELGELKLENESNCACFILPKTYILEGKKFKVVKAKSFEKKKIQSLQFSDFFSCLEGDIRLMAKQGKSPIKHDLDVKMESFRQSLRKGKIMSVSKKSEKILRSKYDKRILVKKGKKWDSIPLTVNMGE